MKTLLRYIVITLAALAVTILVLFVMASLINMQIPETAASIIVCFG
ncbi:hypothetical protein swp_2446 [Shewanella piezotolerans WP3]|uniref:Uncharacterized protein n=1 Tax=Shewanella piezotolerans (strain WP3 / JCM 13877) TaxID=225849 RepID=B8CMD2_SHEPW|nr:hypothetical protein [Shewanella piezotolerans]ACJ29189.1 hypothetical protein swp_2446 [Shewanella piezotolerans WP3]